MRLWFTRLAAAIVVIAGPTLLLYVAADIYSRYPLGREGWPFPLNFQLAAACGYALAIGLVSAQYGALRTLVAVIGCIVVPIFTAIVTIPLMFGLTAGGPPTWAWAAWMALFAVPTAMASWCGAMRHNASRTRPTRSAPPRSHSARQAPRFIRPGHAERVTPSPPRP